mmetsp:Transcript_71018/g.156702  ORF Transcript_71018/g.156702 Transcript_71018/m.156702 type:complete len:130 (-) Transcript_71018:2118-2507(-)
MASLSDLSSWSPESRQLSGCSEAGEWPACMGTCGSIKPSGFRPGMRNFLAFDAPSVELDLNSKLVIPRKARCVEDICDELDTSEPEHCRLQEDRAVALKGSWAPSWSSSRNDLRGTEGALGSSMVRCFT